MLSAFFGIFYWLQIVADCQLCVDTLIRSSSPDVETPGSCAKSVRNMTGAVATGHISRYSLPYAVRRLESPMRIPTSLTPLSQSILVDAAHNAHHRHARALSLGGGFASNVDSACFWDYNPAAALTVAAWGQSPEKVAHLFSTVTPPPTQGNAKISNTIKEAQKALLQIAENQRRSTIWAEGILVLQWSQAELLQVMEEIEPAVTDALYDTERLATIAVGGYARLLEVLDQRLKRSTPELALDLIAGLETPDSAMVADLRQGMAQETWLARYGYRADQAWELASPRLGEMPAGPDIPSDLSGAWDTAAARQRREQAMQNAISGVGLLHRSGLRTLLGLAQQALVAHAEARDVVERILAASRRWCLAAADEGTADQRLDYPEELFLLELEEVKQMMTGEWHSRSQIQPLLDARRHLSQKPSQAAPVKGQPIGIAGDAHSGQTFYLNNSSVIPDVPTHAIALAAETTPAWSPLFLKIDGIVTQGGDWLCHTATVGRGGGLPTIVVAPDSSDLRSGQVLQLDPAQNRLKIAN